MRTSFDGIGTSGRKLYDVFSIGKRSSIPPKPVAFRGGKDVAFRRYGFMGADILDEKEQRFQIR